MIYLENSSVEYANNKIQNMVENVGSYQVIKVMGVIHGNVLYEWNTQNFLYIFHKFMTNNDTTALY